MFSSVSRWLLVAAAGGMLCACSTTERIPLRYSPSDYGIANDSPVRPMRVGVIEDRRTRSAAYLGSLRSGVGKPFKRLETFDSTTSVLRKFIVDALRNRGSYDPQSANEITVEVLALEANQFIRSEFYGDFIVSVTNVETRKSATIGPVRVVKMKGGIATVGNALVGSATQFQDFIEAGMSEAADLIVAKAAR